MTDSNSPVSQQELDAQAAIQARPCNDLQLSQIASLRHAAEVLYSEILGRCPPGRRRALALTALEECSMWATKAISHEG